MRKLAFVAALVMGGNLTLIARGAGLAKIDRRIAREPTYQHQPKYCLLLFGPQAKTRVWLVLDGDILYVDRNGNGNLTEKGKQVAALKPTQVYAAGNITEPDRGSKHTLSAVVGTPGLGAGTFATYKAREVLGQPNERIAVRVAFPHRDSKARPIVVEGFLEPDS
jgi:hypothetical protein